MTGVDIKSAKDFAERLIRSNPSEFVLAWATSTKIENTQEIATRVAWLGAHLGKDTKGMLELYLAGAGAGSVGLLTLNQIAIDLQAAGLDRIDAKTLERFVKYEEGVEGRARKTVGASTNFKVDVALRCAATQIKNTDAPVKKVEDITNESNTRAVSDKNAAAQIKTAGKSVKKVITNTNTTESNIGTIPEKSTIASNSLPAVAPPTRIDSQASTPRQEYFFSLSKTNPTISVVFKYTDGTTPGNESYAPRQSLMKRHLNEYSANSLANTCLENMGSKLENAPRPEGKGINMIVFHCTGGYDTRDPSHPKPVKNQSQTAYNTFKNYSKNYRITDKNSHSTNEKKTIEGLNVGAHFLIKEDGTIEQLAPIETITMHAMGFNLSSIGVEIAAANGASVNKAQTDAATKLSAYLIEKYPEIQYVAGHFELYDAAKPYAALFSAGGKKSIEDVRRIGKPDPGLAVMTSIRRGLAERDYALITTKGQSNLLAYKQPAQSSRNISILR